MKKEQKNNSVIKILAGLFITILLIGGYFAYNLYQTYFKGNISGDVKYIYVRTGQNYADFLRELESNNPFINFKSFEKAAKNMELEPALKPGRYAVKEGLNNRTLINKIKSGNQDAVEVKIQNIRKKSNFIAFLAKHLEADSTAFSKVLDSLELIEAAGFTAQNSYTMYLPNSYQFYWNITPQEFFDKMKKEYDKFWTDERKQKAKIIGLDQQQVIVLASIVDAEALFDKEMPTIAGLYLNRLEKGIRLQADPTVIFANDDFTVKRVTGALLRVDSKYNTYLYGGLPPGPIMMPSLNAINAVLDREKNNYIYMCAKEDFSGYHNFAVTVQEHNINAKKYREALNKRNIFR